MDDQLDRRARGRGRWRVLFLVIAVASLVFVPTASVPRTVDRAALLRQCLDESPLGTNMPAATANWQPGAFATAGTGTTLLVGSTSQATIVCQWDAPRNVEAAGLRLDRLSGTSRADFRVPAPSIRDGLLCFSGSWGIYGGPIPPEVTGMTLTSPDGTTATAEVVSGTFAVAGSAVSKGARGLRVRATDRTGAVVYEGPLAHGSSS